ncbi:MAG: hypothetical protein R6U15_01005 [Candidatus Izemoplasmatales bacterium]
MNENFPKTEMKYNLSKDQKYIIVKTIITDIKSVNYIDKVRVGNETNELEKNKN